MRTLAFSLIVAALAAPGCSSFRIQDVGDAIGPAADLFLLARPSSPEELSAPSAEIVPEDGPESQPTAEYVWFPGGFGGYAGGAAVGFLAHEGGHLLTHATQGNGISLDGVEFAFVPFFTINPKDHQTDRQHFITASAGFNMQNIGNEIILSTLPNLKNEDKPFLRGLVGFNLLLSVGYSMSAFATYGPDERDTKGMADSLGVSEGWIGALVLAPALLDVYRLEFPDQEWAAWLSRALKALTMGLTFTIDSRDD
jgi:hypothetical protein